MTDTHIIDSSGEQKKLFRDIGKHPASKAQFPTEGLRSLQSTRIVSWSMLKSSCFWALFSKETVSHMCLSKYNFTVAVELNVAQTQNFHKVKTNQ